eukprot:m.93654 g.93654  ORF g.93654 m.93654 type:complete len:63 (+) comp20313_c0_seq1:1545-1733(+)
MSQRTSTSTFQRSYSPTLTQTASGLPPFAQSPDRSADVVEGEDDDMMVSCCLVHSFVHAPVQ